jgi:hypothetical protein
VFTDISYFHYIEYGFGLKSQHRFSGKMLRQANIILHFMREAIRGEVYLMDRMIFYL